MRLHTELATQIVPDADEVCGRFRLRFVDGGEPLHAESMRVGQRANLDWTYRAKFVQAGAGDLKRYLAAISPIQAGGKFELLPSQAFDPREGATEVIERRPSCDDDQVGGTAQAIDLIDRV